MSLDEGSETGNGETSLPSEVGAVVGDEIVDEIRAAAAKVPWIGEGWRWYDIPYRLGTLLLASRLRVLLGWRGQQWVQRWMNFLVPFNQVERDRAGRRDRPLHNLLVPSGEHVQTAGIWVTEFILPSDYAEFLACLRRNGWDRHAFLSSMDGSNVEQVTAARGGRGWLWWSLATITTPEAGFRMPGSVKDVLPPEFQSVDVRAMQVGTSLTAITAFFALSDHGERCLDAVWHADHEPALRLNGMQRPSVENRYFAAIRAGQTERQRLHGVARAWLSTHAKGAFARSSGGQPVIDMLLFEKADLADEPVPDELRDGLRALALDGVHRHAFRSPSLPGLAFVPSNEHPRGYERVNNCWAVVGRLDRVAELATHAGYGEPPYGPRTLGHMYQDEVQAFLTYLAAIRFLSVMTTEYAAARDLAPSRHGRFGVRQLQRFRQELLTRSLDLAMVERDLVALWSPRWRAMAGIRVVCADPNDWPADATRRPDFDYIRDLGKVRKRQMRALRRDDAAYREVLVTVASLGASIEASRTGRRALFVAGVSVLVAAVTLVVTDVSAHSLWGHFWHAVHH